MRRSPAMSSIQARDYRAEAFPLPGSMERRSWVRFPLEWNVRFRTLGESYPAAGVGSIVNISSGGVLVAYEEEINVGTLVELNIEWPVLLDGRVPLQLVAAGAVVRCEIMRFAVALERYHFRTAGGMHREFGESCGEARKPAVKKSAIA